MVTIRPVDRDDADVLLAWANDPTTRAASFDAHEITPDEHERWLTSVLTDPAERAFVGELDGLPIGVVRVSGTEPPLTISITVAPAARGRRLAGPLISAGTARVGLETIALVKSSNERSLRAFEAAGYETVERDDEVIRLRWRPPSDA